MKKTKDIDAIIYENPNINWVSKAQQQKNDEERKIIWHKQIMIYKDLQQELGKNKVLKQHWVNQCKTQNTPFKFRPDKAKSPYFATNWKHFKQLANDYNHRVKSIEYLDGNYTVYNITVDDNHTLGIITNIEKDENGNIKKYTGIQAKNSEQSLESSETCCFRRVVFTEY